MTPPHEGVGSLYIHAPFCARRCIYCDFAVHLDRDPRVTSWIETVAAELALLEADPAFRLSPRLETLYVGGGTPSLLGPGVMRGLADAIGEERLAAPDLEWTAEANPESLTAEVAGGWSAAGVNRLSLGVQSFDARALEWMGRLHGPEGGPRAVSIARDAGIQNISIDLIFALPNEVSRSWERDLEAALALEVSHISLYGLTVEAGTRLARIVAEGNAEPAEAERYRREFLMAADTLAGAGYEHYEVSNFARPGLRSRHNSVYWSGAPYVGVGNGAHSYRFPVRRWNIRSWEEYREAVREGRSPEEERESLATEQAELEALWLGLRTDTGIATDRLEGSAPALLNTWVERGLASVLEGTLRLTAEGWLVMDRLTLDLEEALSGR